MTFQKETMTQAIQSTSAVLIVHATTANIYTTAKDSARKKVLTMTEYIENQLSGKLRGVTYEDGKIIDVHIRDTDDVVKVFVPVRHGRWIIETGENGLQRGYRKCSQCGEIVKYRYSLYGAHNFCNYCGCLMDGGDD